MPFLLGGIAFEALAARRNFSINAFLFSGSDIHLARPLLKASFCVGVKACRGLCFEFHTPMHFLEQNLFLCFLIKKGHVPYFFWHSSHLTFKGPCLFIKRTVRLLGQFHHTKRPYPVLQGETRGFFCLGVAPALVWFRRLRHRTFPRWAVSLGHGAEIEWGGRWWQGLNLRAPLSLQGPSRPRPLPSPVPARLMPCGYAGQIYPACQDTIRTSPGLLHEGRPAGAAFHFLNMRARAVAPRGPVLVLIAMLCRGGHGVLRNLPASLGLIFAKGS